MYLKPDGESLRQGDIIDREKLKPALKGHQDYIAWRKDFEGYCVITQACDLVRGRNVDFIQVAVIRNLLTVFASADTPTQPSKKAHDFLRDVLGQEYNKRGFFYLRPEQSAGISENCVVDLRTMFSLHVQHYEEILHARKLSMSDTAANKLGWMAGQLFSRVPTPDWEELKPDKRDLEIAQLFERIRSVPRREAAEVAVPLEKYTQSLISE